ncbi:major capsid protein [Sigmofec virus UA08Rod_4138]|uniref:Major capsid protein n=1 Tax=Sigmofec virus UA08Rod_4138 TaxID=2929396 RepID=A0A976N1U1_9VIRU|nr:major capsid protein [Sigmofec virus UA08Rod_4138]
MASNPFTATQGEKNNVRRNVWDWTHYNNLTTEIGRLTPCFCRRVPAGTSLRINADFALKFMPMMFPIQSRIKARLNFFRMPVRALWKNYPDWISSVNQKAQDGTDINSKYVPPFVAIDSSTSSYFYSHFHEFMGTGSDLDYMGVPTEFDSADVYFAPESFCAVKLTSGKTTIPDIGDSYSHTCMSSGSGMQGVTYLPFSFGSFRGLSADKLSFTLSPAFKSYVDSLNIDTASSKVMLVITHYDSSASEVVESLAVVSSYNDGVITFAFGSNPRDFSSSELHFAYIVFEKAIPNSSIGSLFGVIPFDSALFNTGYSPITCPWFDVQTGKGLKISSLPLRMREAVYNAYIRNDRNNPLVVSGVPKYNDWVLAYEKDGNDTWNYAGMQIQGYVNGEDYFYGRRYVNWEPDYLSTAVPSPQEGIAPLVGLQNYASVVSSEDGVTSLKLNSVLTDEDGNAYSVNYLSDKEGLKGVTYTQLNVYDDLGKPLSNLYQAVSSGISIEDFRQVNAYQRYLELNMRRGYSYKDIIEGRYDVNVRYDSLLMPEFLGGFTRDVSVTPVTQTTPTDETGTYQGSLGSQAGDAYVAGSPDVSINCYCDEDSIVMGFISVSPVPIYSQTLLKDFLINDPLDIFSPEFSNIGFQPITLAEVSPIQAFAQEGSASLSKVFGYQRPWYHLLSMTDQAHGLFRSQLKNFIMKRTWTGVPVLGVDFLLVKPEQVNDVFSVTETTDKIFGQIKFDIKCKNEVPRDVVPRLE